MNYERPMLSYGVAALSTIRGTQDKGNPPGDGQCTGADFYFCAGDELDE